MSKADHGNITEHLDDATPSRRATLAAIAGCVAAASVRPAAATTSTTQTQSFRDAIEAYQQWSDNLDWPSIHLINPDFDGLSATSDEASDRYHALFRKCCAEHAAAPSLVGLGEVYSLWRERCWSSDKARSSFLQSLIFCN
jgi:hypothetical protein